MTNHTHKKENRYICIHKVKEPLILEPEDYTEQEWAVIRRIFGMVSAERIVISDFKLEAYGVPTKGLEHLESIERGYIPASEWISVKNKMPEMGIAVLIVTKSNYITTARLYCNDDTGNCWWIGDDEYTYDLNRVPYWMPLPKSPNLD